MTINEQARITHLVRTLGVDNAKKCALEYCKSYDDLIFKNKNGQMFFNGYKQIIDQLLDFINDYK